MRPTRNGGRVADSGGCGAPFEIGPLSELGGLLSGLDEHAAERHRAGRADAWKSNRLTVDFDIKAVPMC